MGKIMKKLIIIAGIVLMLMACNNGGSMGTIENPVTVTFDTDGGADIAPMTVEAFSTIKLPTPQKDGYEFIGWYVMQLDQKRLVSGSSYELKDRDITFYARFVIWYPFEVSNISHTLVKDELHRVYLLSITWDNPTDANFSHAGMAVNEFDLKAHELEPGVNSWDYSFMEESLIMIIDLSFHIRCFDKNGNQSKGIQYSLYKK